MRKPIHFPIGSISSGTMRAEDLIPTFCSELDSLARQPGIVSAKRRKDHARFVRLTELCLAGDCDHNHMEDCPDSSENYYQSEAADNDLETLFDMLGEHAGPYFYFGAHPGDGSDYGFWLSEGLADEFDGLKVSDTSEIPSKYRGEVLHVNDHGNCSSRAPSRPAAAKGSSPCLHALSSCRLALRSCVKRFQSLAVN